MIFSAMEIISGSGSASVIDPKISSGFRTSASERIVSAKIPFPRGSRARIRSRVAMTMRPQSDLAGLFHGGADHIESFLGHLAVGCQEVGVVPIDPVDFGLRNKALDVDGPGALQPDRFDLFVWVTVVLSQRYSNSDDSAARRCRIVQPGFREPSSVATLIWTVIRRCEPKVVIQPWSISTSSPTSSW
jgi:hypothetical protein